MKTTQKSKRGPACDRILSRLTGEKNRPKPDETMLRQVCSKFSHPVLSHFIVTCTSAVNNRFFFFSSAWGQWRKPRSMPKTKTNTKKTVLTITLRLVFPWDGTNKLRNGFFRNPVPLPSSCGNVQSPSWQQPSCSPQLLPGKQIVDKGKR